MAGRIRTIKPEWLEDEIALQDSDTRVASIGLILLADDHGRGRANEVILGSAIFPGSHEKIRETLARLSRLGFLSLYEVRGQVYFQIMNWARHQRVDKPGKPRVPCFCEQFHTVSECPGNVPGSLGNIPPTLATDHVPTTDDRRPTTADRRPPNSKDQSVSDSASRMPTEPPTGIPGEHKLSAAKRKVLSRFRAESLALWAYQNELRTKVVLNARTLSPIAERVLRIAECLDAGRTVEECRAVLEQTADRVRKDQAQKDWFNGTSCWRSENFDRTLGSAQAAPAPAKPGQFAYPPGCGPQDKASEPPRKPQAAPGAPRYPVWPPEDDRPVRGA